MDSVFFHFFQNSSELFCICSLQGNILHTNAVWLTRLGWNTEDLKNLSILNFIHPEDRKDFELALTLDSDANSRVLCQDETYIRINWHTRKDSKNNFIYLSSSNLPEKGNSDAFLNNIMRNLDDMVFELDTECKYVNVWTSQEDKLRFPRSAFLGKKISEVISPSLARPFEEAVSLCLKTGTRQEIEFFSEKEPQKWYFIKVFPLLEENKKVRSVCFLVSDITEKKSVENRLRKSEELYKHIENATQDGIWDWTLATGYCYFSSKWKNMLGYEDQELQNTIGTWYELIHHEDTIKAQEIFKKHSKNGQPFFDMFRFKHKNGSLLWIMCRGTVLKDTHQKPYRIVGSHTDITSFIQVQNELKVERDRLSTLTAHIPLFIAEFDENGDFVWINRAFESTFGWTLNELQSDKAFIDKFYPEKFEKDRAISFMTQVRGHWSDFVPRSKSGNFVDSSWYNVDLGNGHTLSLGTDITDRKKTEAQLVEKEKMATLGHMAGSIAHEINNPLAVILTSAERLEKLAQQEKIDLQTLEKLSGLISKTAIRIAKIIRSLRMFSRHGHSDPFVPTKASDILNDVLSLVESTLKNAGVQLNTDLSADFEVDCRSVQIVQVLVNLISNSNDALTETSRKTISLHVRATDHEAIFEVEDNGPGVPEELMAKIFHPFFTTKQLNKGTGLGLSISKGIGEAHSGRLEVESRPGCTKFTLRVPLKQGASTYSA